MVPDERSFIRDWLPPPEASPIPFQCPSSISRRLNAAAS